MAAGREPWPSIGIRDSQSVKTTEAGGPKGYDAGKKVSGRKRHILVDTLGLLLAVVVTPANVEDDDEARLVLGTIQHKFRRPKALLFLPTEHGVRHGGSATGNLVIALESVVTLGLAALAFDLACRESGLPPTGGGRG